MSLTFTNGVQVRARAQQKICKDTPILLNYQIIEIQRSPRSNMTCLQHVRIIVITAEEIYSERLTFLAAEWNKIWYRVEKQSLLHSTHARDASKNSSQPR